MGQANSKADWSDKHWKDRLKQQRVSMWPEDTVAMLAAWMKLRRGMTAVDIGCGLGYLGYTYWPYFGEGGHYIGVDISPELVRDARKAADEWGVNGKASFYVANGCRLPLPDDVADCVMCQTLLMHLEKPEAALSEMIRVAKPGALILCKEPDNQSWWQARHYSSLPELDIEEQLLHSKIYLVARKGRMELGRGDNAIGPRVAPLMKRLGLTDIEVRISDQVGFYDPPYRTARQKSGIDEIRKKHTVESLRHFWLDRLLEEFIAGGGDAAEFGRFRRMIDMQDSILEKQLEAGEYHLCGTELFYVVRGTKPGLA